MSEAAPARSPALDIRGLSKSFDGAVALDEADLTVAAGSIHALLGGNGSGKSTLIKALAGVQPADAGTITVWDRTVDASAMSPDAAARTGLRFVHQDLGLFDDFTVAENVAFATGYPGTRGRIRWRQLTSEVRALLERFEIDAAPTTILGHLRPATRTMVAVARALRDDDGTGTDTVLVLDEPTASLPDHEVDVLLSAIRQRARLGQTVVYVSHRLQEVLSLADHVSVLRDGSRVATTPTDGLDVAAVTELIAGRPQGALYPARDPVAASDVVLETTELSAGPLRDISVSVRRSEIVGLGGLVGSGRTSLLRGIFGDLPVRAGSLRVGDHRGPFANPKVAVGAGVALVPEQRLRDAAFADLPLRENLSISVLETYFRRPWLDRASERRDATELLGRYLVKAGSCEDPLTSLSGGNQQKIILARWLRRLPALLLLDEPTQGVDVVARAEIYRLIRSAARAGSAVLIASSDYEELANVCDRVLVLDTGRVTAELQGPTLTVPKLIEAANQSHLTEVSA